MDIIKLLQRAYRAYRRKKNWQRVVRAMAMVVVFCTTYALILPAITMESGTICGLTEHTHTDACYVAVTEPEAHTHTGECYEKSLVCTLDESEGHNHSDSCNGIIEKLICTADHEEHVATCYSYETGLVCGLEESEGHSHGDACWESKLICGLEEAVEETTGATEETEETTGEAEEAVKRELVCGLEEHTHDESCYPVTEPETTENISASVDADPEADLETQEDWEASLSGVSLTGDWSADILAIAASQLGYTESQSNYITDENGQTFHYTRYGQWYGAPYGDWSAMFVSFCLRYAQVEGIPADQDCQNLLNVLKDEEIYLEKGQYAPVPGDLVFLDKNADGVCDAVGIVEEIVAATEEAPEMVRFLAGDWEGRVERVTMEAQDVSVLGYAVLPTEPDDTQEHTFAGEDGMSAQVALDALTTAVPEDAVLTIEAVTEADEEYAAMTEQVDALVEKEILDITMLDISFYDAQGEYIGVGESASVSLTFPGDAFGGNAVKVFHFTEDGPTELSGVSYYYEYETAEDGTETMQTVLTFNTEGFSVFAITNIQGEYEVVTVTDTAQLDGNTFYIVNGNQTYIMQDTMATGDLGLEKVAYSQENLKTSTTWTFIKQEDGTFHIRSDSGFYVKMADENYSDGYTTVSLTAADDEANATNFTISVLGANDKGAYIDIGYNGPNNGFHYLNVYQGTTDFRGWKDPGTQDSGSRIILYMAKESSGTIQTVNGLDGKEFAIVSNVVYNGFNKSLATTAEKVNNGQGLITIDTQQVVIDGINCVDGEAVLWKFEKTETEGAYYISTTVDENKKYLRMLDTHEAATPDGRGSLTLGDQPQPITVIANDDGTVSLSATVSTTENDTVTGYVNLDTTAYNFWTYNQNVDSCKLLLCQKSDLDSSFGLRYGTYTIRFNLQDVNGNKLYTAGEDKEVDATASVIFSDAGFAPEIDGYVLVYATYEDGNGQTFTVKSLGPAGTQYRIYDADYDETNNPNLFHTMDRDSEITLVYRVDAEPILYYNYNYDWKGDGWVTGEPGIPAESQTIATDTDKLYTVSGKNADGMFIRDTLTRGTENEFYNNTLNNGKQPGDPNYLPPGAEYKFLYWVANNTDGEECHFPEGAEVYLDDAGYIRIKDTEDNWQTVWPGTTLRGEWDMISNVIYFYVNHGDTMLEGEDNQTITSTDPGYYTEIAAIGHIYNLDKLSHDNHYAADGTIRIATHDEIEKLLVPVYDPSSPKPQIVIDAVKDGTTSNYEVATNYNEALLETAVALYIQSQNNKTIKLDGAILDKSMITPENYKLYWYGLKLVDTDSYAYHMDGVLVAKTDPVYIYKTFSGLPNHMQTDSPANTLISKMQFPLYLLSKNSNGVWTRDSYTTLFAGGSQAGVYEADGWQRDSSNIYQWTLQMVKGQTYALEEINHELDGYDCLSLISVHYNDESDTVVYQYNTTKTFEDTGEGTLNSDGVMDNIPIEDLFNNGVDSDGNSISTEKGIVGGEVKSITFANFYTKTDTGMFSISKTADDAGQVRLPGAKFNLVKVDETGTEVTGDGAYNQTFTTNEYGSVHFSDLSVGTYILSEVAPPPGYQELLYEGTTPVTWTVTVTMDENSKITVTIWENDKDGKYSGSGTILYDQKNSRIKVYQIKNEPVNTTVEVYKYFIGITTAEVQSLYDNYYISVLASNGEEKAKLTLNDAHPMAGQLYNWTISLDPGDYTFKEHNFLYSQAYLDTMVTVTTDAGCTAGAVVKSDSTPDNGSAEHDLATFTVTKGGAAGTVNITNSYTNEFILRIHKVDATNSNTGMSGVKFNIFGDFEQATGTETMTYKDANGVEHTVYLVKTLETDSNGYAQYDEMRLSSSSRTFLYVISEVSTPAGYVALTDPIVKVVSIDSENYSNGVYDLEIENFEASKVSANVSITAKKEWDLPSGLSPTTIKLHLYQKDSTGAITDCGYVELNGTKTGTGTTTGGSQNVSYTIGADGWTVTWTGLTYATSETRHEYYVVEEPMAGYHTTYSYPESIYANGELTAAGRAVGDKQLERSVTITNTSGYALPETGGAGTRWMAPLGLMLILAAAAMYWLGIEKKKQGGVDSS